MLARKHKSQSEGRQIKMSNLLMVVATRFYYAVEDEAKAIWSKEKN